MKPHRVELLSITSPNPNSIKTMQYLLTLAAMLALARPASAAVPPAINYQGRLTNAAGVPQPGVRGMSVKIYDSATTGAPLYSEAVGNVTVDANGVYGFEFGLVGAGGSGTLGAALAGSIEQWLELEVDGVAQNPRQKILAVPFALMAGGLPDGAVSASMIADGAIPVAKITGLGSAATSDTSTVGGANKTAQFDSDGRLRMGPINTTPSNPAGALRIPSRQRIEWENEAGVVNGNVWMFTGHSGGDELVWSLARECHYWDEGFQLGQAGTARSQQYMYFHSLGAADSSDPFRESTPVYFDGSYWTGYAEAASNVGVQWAPSGDHAGELAFSMTGSSRSYGASGKVANIRAAVKAFSVTQTGPKIPAGKVLTFGDGTTLATKPELQARTGNLTLVTGTKSISNTTVTTKTNILLTRRSSGGFIGDLTYSTTPGTGFTVTSTSGADTSRVSYLLVEDTVASNSPTISGTTAVTDILSASSGGGSGAFQWYSNGVPVPGATASTYAVRH